MIENEPDLHVVGEAGDGLQAVSEAEKWQPDVAFLDAGLPNCDGIRATALIRERVPGCRICVLSSGEDETTLVEAVGSGASGYLTKESPLVDLIEAARIVHRGETLIPRHMLGALLSRLIHNRREQDAALRLIGKLTRREKEVLSLLAGGADNDGIAEELVISPQTARTHIQNVLYKLGVHSRLEAAAFVIQNGIEGELAAVKV